MLYQELITQAFEKMGPERVAGGRTATGYEWHNCFLAVALGRHLNSVATAARLTGLEFAEIETIMRMWDRNQAAFVALESNILQQRFVACCLNPPSTSPGSAHGGSSTRS